MPALNQKAVHLCPSLGRKIISQTGYQPDAKPNFPKPEKLRKNVPEKPFGLSASPLADHQCQYCPRTSRRLSVGYSIRLGIVDLPLPKFKPIRALSKSFFEILLRRHATRIICLFSPNNIRCPIFAARLD